MSMYDLNQNDAKMPVLRTKKEGRARWLAALIVIVALAAGFLAGGYYYDKLAGYLDAHAKR